MKCGRSSRSSHAGHSGHQNHVLGDLVRRNFLKLRRPLAAHARARLGSRDITHVAVVAQPVKLAVAYHDDLAGIECAVRLASSLQFHLAAGKPRVLQGMQELGIVGGNRDIAAGRGEPQSLTFSDNEFAFEGSEARELGARHLLRHRCQSRQAKSRKGYQEQA